MVDLGDRKLAGPSCILHVGMPKTGSSSIQQSLFFERRNRRYRYYSAGEINGSRMLWTVATPGNPALHHWMKRVDPEFLDRKRRRYLAGMERQLLSAHKGGSMCVFSGEDAWDFSESQVRQLKELFLNWNVPVRVIIYLRTWKEFLESNYQQRLQLATVRPQLPPAQPDFAPVNIGKLDYQQRITLFDQCFGQENVLVRKFDPGEFPGGCVVRDFCRQIGLTMDSSKIRRANESIGLNAVKMLHAYKLYGTQETSWLAITEAQHHQMILCLRKMPDTPFWIHSQVAKPILEPLQDQISWLEKRLKSSFREDVHRHDSDRCIRSREDLFTFDHASLQWLAAQSRSPMPSSHEGEGTAKRVATMIHRLRHQIPSVRNLQDIAGRCVERMFARWRRGDR